MESLARHLVITILATLLTVVAVIIVHKQYVAPSVRAEIVSAIDAKTKAVAKTTVTVKPAAKTDTDKDGLTDDLEVFYGTDPHNPDTDNDGYPDGLEVKSNYSPLGRGRMPGYKVASQKQEAAVLLKEPSMVYIDSLNIKVPLIYITDTGEKAFQEGLINGVVHYPNTAKPGELGSMYIFGHSSDYMWSKGKYKQIFAPLPKIKVGAMIVVTDDTGKPYTYKVYDAFVAEANDLEYLDQYGFKRKLLTVQTSYPVGTAKQRFIALAELVE